MAIQTNQKSSKVHIPVLYKASRKRGDNQSIQPHIVFPDDMNNRTQREKWVKELVTQSAIKNQAM